MTKPANQTDSFGKFKFELRGVGCRTVVIPDRITLLELHSVVQALFGWYNEHLWEFRDADGRRYAAKRPDYVPLFGVEEKCIPPGKVRLSDVLPAPGAKLFYTYDFGDSWHHVITRQATPKTPGRRCVKTEGPDGIEDIGGVPGLMESKDEWFVPSAEQITERLARVPLKPSRSGPGLLDREKAKQESAIRALNSREWDWFCAFAESGYARLGAPNRRLETLLGLLPGVRLSRLAFLAPEEQGTYQADTPFKRFWRQNRDGWARLRGLPPFPARCSEPRRAERNAIYAFACSAAVLYGAVGKADLLELFEHWRVAADWLRNATPETAVWALESVRRRMYDFGAPAYVRDGLAVSAAKYPPPPLDTPIGPDPALDATLAARKGKERWHPASLKEFLAFQRGAHFLHKEYEDLEAFIRTAWHVDPENRMDALAVHAAVCTAHDAIAAGHGWQKIVSVMLGCLGKEGIEDSVLQRLVHLLLLASNATRMDAHWGFTPDEMFAKYGPGSEADARMAPELPPDAMPTPPAPRPAKIGRNDPCPCGSGKKYKKCCGRPR